MPLERGESVRERAMLQPSTDLWRTSGFCVRVMRSPGSGALQASVLMGVVRKRKGRVESNVSTPEEIILIQVKKSRRQRARKGTQGQSGSLATSARNAGWI